MYRTILYIVDNITYSYIIYTIYIDYYNPYTMNRVG